MQSFIGNIISKEPIRCICFHSRGCLQTTCCRRGVTFPRMKANILRATFIPPHWLHVFYGQQVFLDNVEQHVSKYDPEKYRLSVVTLDHWARPLAPCCWWNRCGSCCRHSKQRKTFQTLVLKLIYMFWIKLLAAPEFKKANNLDF